MGNIIVDAVTENLGVPEEFSDLKKYLFESSTENMVDLRKKFTPLSIVVRDQQDAESLIKADEILDKVGEYALFCKKGDEEALFDKLIRFVDEHSFQFIIVIETDTLIIYVIRPAV